MKPLRSLLLILIFAALSGCSSDSSTDPADNGNDNTGDIIATGSIDIAGGIVTSDNVSIDIPANAFSTSTQVEVYLAAESPFSTGALSASYTIEGIPSDYSKPLKLALRKTSSGTGSQFIAVGSETFSKSMNSTSIAFKMFPARDSLGFLVIDLPARDANLTKLNDEYAFSENLTLQVEAVSATQTSSSSSHFKIIHSSSLTSQAATLAGYLEEAYSKYKNMGFVYDVTTPIEVNILDLGSEYYGKYSYNLWSDWLEFNSRKINDYAELRTTAGHEFFHWVQIRYDNRMWASKVLSNGDRYWFEEASAVWAEEKFSSSTSYCSDARSSFELQPFYGVQAGAAGDPEGHGYGMSALVKYLAGKYGDSIVKNIFDKLTIGLKPCDALQICTQDPVSYWLPEFFVEYAKGEIYSDVSTAMMISDTHTARWEINYTSDTLKTFTFSSADLSAKIFDIKINCDLLQATTQMTLSLTDSDYLSLHLFSYKGSEIVYLGTLDGSIVVSQLKAFKDAGYHLMALAVNSQITAPYTNTTNATLQITVDEPVFDFSICKWAYVNVYVNLNTYHPYSNENVWNMQTIVIGNVSAGAAEGIWSGNTFTADLPGPLTGSISITIDPVTAEVLSFSASSSYTSVASVAGHNVPFGYPVYDGTTFQAIGFVNEVIGTATCEHLTTVDYYLDSPSPNDMLNFSTLGYQCTTDAHVTVGFFWDISSWSENKFSIKKAER